MAQQNPGFSGFMSNIMNPNLASTSTSSMNGPPPPIATQGPNAVPPPTSRPGNNNFARPDLNMSRSNFADDGIRFEEKSKRRPAPPNNNNNNNDRREMTGPKDLVDILSGIKTKTINIDDNCSVVSVEETKSETKKNNNYHSKRKPRSASNTVSLDI
jgi:hypothetical protein